MIDSLFSDVCKHYLYVLGIESFAIYKILGGGGGHQRFVLKD